MKEGNKSKLKVVILQTLPIKNYNWQCCQIWGFAMNLATFNVKLLWNRF